MNGEMRLLNAQRSRRIDLRLLREILVNFLETSLHLKDYDLVLHFVGEKKMAHVNEIALQHEGSTDVITFDFSSLPPLPQLAGELYVCVDEAVLQAKRFMTTWQEEIVRYCIHGILHLCGYDDLKPAAKRVMKREENRRLREITRGFNLSKLQPKFKVKG